jgi:hypothetical protein
VKKKIVVKKKNKMAKRKVKKIYKDIPKVDWVRAPIAIAGGLVGLAIGVQALKLIHK